MAFAESVGNILAAFGDLLSHSGSDAVFLEEFCCARGSFDVEAKIVESLDQGSASSLSESAMVARTVP